MKVIILLAILGLSLAGFRADMKKVGHWISKHHQAIESGVGDALKVGEAVAEDSELINVQGLITNGIKTVGDATQKKKNVGQLVQDGLNILGDLTSGNDNSNSEELFNLGSWIQSSIIGTQDTIANDIKGTQDTLTRDAIGTQDTINNDIQGTKDTVATITKNLPAFINSTEHGLAYAAKHFDSAQATRDIQEGITLAGTAVTTAEDIMKLVSAGMKIAGTFADDELVNVQGLVNNGIKTVQDATQKKKNVGQLVQDGLNILGDLTSGDDSNSEELFNLGSWIQSSIIGTQDTLTRDAIGTQATLTRDAIGTQKTLSSDFQGTVATVTKAVHSIKESDVINAANDIAKAIGTGLNLANGILGVVNEGLGVADQFVPGA